MAEETGTSQTQETTPEGNTFTQEQLDAIIADRLSREKAKYADYEALKKDAEAYRANKEKQKSALEKANDRVAELEKLIADREAADARAELITKVMEEHNVDAKYAALLTADSEEELVAQATLLGERFADTSTRDSGKPADVGTDENADEKEFVRNIFSQN